MPREKLKPCPVFDRLRGEASVGEGLCEWLQMRDGTKIFLQSWMPEEAPRGAVVCFHGAGGHGQFFALFADFLVPRGVAVFVADYRGHGLSGGVRGDFASFQTLLDDCHEVVTEAKKRLPGVPVNILGESMGGAVAVNYAAIHGDAVAGMILLAPALLFRKSIPWPQILYLPYYLLAAALAPGRPVIGIKGNEEMGIKNPLHIEYDKTDPQHLKNISPRYFLQLNRYMAIGLKECPAKITAHTILFQGGRDPAIDPAGARLFIENLASDEKELVIYPQGLHVLLTDPDVPDLKEKIISFIEKR